MKQSNELRRRARILQHGVPAGELTETDDGSWNFRYFPEYAGPAVSLTLPVRSESYVFPGFPPVFEGLLPEGPQLEALLRLHKIDRSDCFGQLIIVGADLVGSLTVAVEWSAPQER